MKNRFIIICGPTAVGKTKFAVEVAKKYNGELVSADSRQVYRGMDIGTGKDLVNKFEFKNLKFEITLNSVRYSLSAYNYFDIPLWLYDVVNPDQEFSVSIYKILASAVVECIWKRGKLPIIIGGTGMYIKSIIDPFDTIRVPQNLNLRQKLTDFSTDELAEILKKENKFIFETLNDSDRKNPRRLIRRIEIVLFAKKNKDKTILESFQKVNENRVFNNYFSEPDKRLIIGLTAHNSYLYQKIDDRVDDRIQKGIIEEICDLVGKGYSWKLLSFSALGYKQWRQYFEKINIGCKSSDLDLMKKNTISKWKFAEHAYARRQKTWFKAVKDICWYDVSQKNMKVDIFRKIDAWYNNSKL
jgi:tRNA dimethylallyltransferase